MEKESVNSKINDVLQTEFELEPSLLVEKSLLKEDLGLDSLDAVDLIVMLEEKLSIEVEPDLFMKCSTLGDVYNVVNDLVKKIN